MNVINEVGELAMGSRLRRLSDRIMRDGAGIYQLLHLDFEPRWFPVFYLLSQRSPLAIMEIAKSLDVSHPSVIQTVREMEKEGLIVAVNDKNDKRKRLLQLSKKGWGFVPKMQPLWNDIAQAFHEILITQQHNLLLAIQETEEALDEQGLLNRVKEITRQRQLEEIEILDYDPSLDRYFEELNTEWLLKYFRVEEIDRKIFADPRSYIIDPGGTILFARYQNEIVGTCALISKEPGVYEMAKMAVTEKVQGKQIGKRLGLAIIDKAKSLSATKLVLESNKKLDKALNLYRNLGFVERSRPFQKSAYQRSDVYMELELIS